MKLSQCETITDLKKFTHSHENIINGNASEKVKQPYRDRLEKLKKHQNETIEKK